VEVAEDGAAADQRMFLIGQGGAEQLVERGGLSGSGGIVGGAFAGQVALSRHTITLTATQQYGTVRLHDQRATWPNERS